MESICRVSDYELITVIKKARERLLFMAPGLSANLAKVISMKWIELPPRRVNIILDVDPEVYRMGYGEIEALQILEERAKIAEETVHHQPGIRIGLLVADATTIIFSPTPLLIEAGSTNFKHPNAIILKDLPDNVASDVGLGENGLHDQNIGLHKVPSTEIEAVADNLKNNPPVKFDIARKVRVFNAFFEFVDFKVVGCEISRMTVPIRSDLMGLTKDKEAQRKLKSTFALIEKDSKLSGKEILELRKEIDKDFLIPLIGYGSVVLRSNKAEFQNAVEVLKGKVTDFQSEVEKNIENEILANKKSLYDALLPAVKANPPERWKRFIGNEPTGTNIEDMLESDLSKAFGDAKRVTKEMRVILVFKGVTYELLNEKKFIDIAKHAIPSLKSFHEENDAALNLFD